MTPNPAASVVICVYNRPVQVLTCLDSLLRLDPPDFEIVVVDDGSTDETPARVAEFASAHPERVIRVVTHPHNRGLSNARNTGILAATGEVIFFTDSDCAVDPSWVSALLKAFADPAIAAAYGRAIDALPRNWAERAYSVSPRVSAAGWQKRPLIGNCMAFRRSVITKLLFDPAMTYYCDEVDVARRLTVLGYHIAFVPDAIVHHDHPMTVQKYLVLAYRQSQGSARFWYKYGLVGYDLLPLATVALTAPLGFYDPRLLLVPAGGLLIQFLFICYAEHHYKGKSAGDILRVLPLLVTFYIVRALGLLVTFWRIATGAEDPIRDSKRVWKSNCKSLGTQQVPPRRTAPR